MKVRILKNTSVKGEPCSPGEVMDLDDADAGILISYGMAEPVKELPPAEDGGGDTDDGPPPAEDGGGDMAKKTTRKRRT